MANNPHHERQADRARHVRGGTLARRIEQRPFGRTPAGATVDLYTLTSSRGLRAAITGYGGIVVSLETPDRLGRLGDVVLGHDELAGYLEGNRAYFGAVVGRCANRIARGELPLDGATHALTRNDGPNHLHGGHRGFDKVAWEARPVEGPDGVAVQLRYRSPDGEEGYPGNLAVTVTYALTEADELVFDAEATTDRPTLCNLAHHSYFALDRPARRDVLGHLLWIDADRFTPVGEGLLPTGELRPVDGTPLDFRRPVAIGARLGVAHEQLDRAGGYDHNWVLNRTEGGLFRAARVVGPESGRVLEVLTTEPGLQFYSGNFLDGTDVGKRGERYQRRAGLCLEAQRFPDSPHWPAFPSAVLRPGETYRTRTIYRFSTEG